MRREEQMMATGCLNLFEYAARFVTTDDVAAFAPGDPGYPNYVRAFNSILASHELPRRADFDITETIGLTRWCNADREKDPERFRRFRVFTNAVGMALCVRGEGSDDSMPANYLAISLIDDADALRDRELLGLLVPAFDEFHEVLRGQNSEESPFLLLGLLLAKAQLGSPDQEIAELADRIMSEESKYFGRASSDFLWGCTFFNQLHRRWNWFIFHVLNPSTPSAALLREALLAGQRPVK